jgi:hypothetical protein
MEKDTGGTAVRVSHRTARESVTRLQRALEYLDIRTDQIRQINVVSDLSGSYHVRMGTWDPASVHALADAIEGLHDALERPDVTPQPPASS